LGLPDTGPKEELFQALPGSRSLCLDLTFLACLSWEMKKEPRDDKYLPRVTQQRWQNRGWT
jgi:hypothetical protein